MSIHEDPTLTERFRNGVSGDGRERCGPGQLRKAVSHHEKLLVTRSGHSQRFKNVDCDKLSKGTLLGTAS